ncbi:1518_t:CDS:2, partial [Cetraspora pellucida]
EESDVELLALTSTSIPALSTLALSTQNTKFFERYTALELLDNKEVEVEKVSCKFEDYDTEYIWLGSTSNCITYLRDIHQITKESLKNTLVKAEQQMIYQLISRPHSSHVQKKLTYQLVHYIIAYAQPISIVDDDDFRLWTKNLDPQFKVPCVNTIKTVIFNFYDFAINQIIDFISKTSDTIVLDIGKLDEHHASDIVKSVNSVLNKFKINCQNIFFITTDNGSNVSVNLGLKEVDEIISKCKITPGLKEPLDVIKDMNTHWNSTLYVIEYLVYLKPAIIQLYSTLTNYTIREVRKEAETIGPYIPFSEEFELLEKLIKVLFPFDEATQFLSRSKYPTLGFMTPILEELARQLRYFIGQNSMCCSFLNPHFKKLNFCTSALWHTTIQNMRQQFNELCLIQTFNNNLTSTNDNNPSLTSLYQCKKTKISAFFMHLHTENSNVEPDEFDRYCELPSIALDEKSCPLEWWCKHNIFFPTMAILARRYLAVPASSIPSERLFSDAKNHIMDKHNRLDPDFLNKL